MKVDGMSENQDNSAAPYRQLPKVACGGGLNFLDGIRVIDLTTSVAGPYATMLLADYGAEVIKIERPHGDDARHWGPPFLDGEALWFLAMNRNKKSVTMDMRHPQDRAMFEELVKGADVVVTNQPPNVQAKLKLDYETLKGLRQDLVFVSITGFGLEGERSELVCYDLIAEGYSGIMDVTGAPDSPPQKVGAPAADMLAGQDAATTAIAALFDRMKTGKGRKIDISLVESMTRFLACRISPYLGAGVVPKRSGGTDSVIAIYQAFETADEPITLGLGNDAIWARFWDALGDPEYAARPEYKSNSDRQGKRAEIVEHIQSILVTRGKDHWLELFGKARIPSGPINSLDELCADEEFQRRRLFYTAVDEAGREVPQIGLGISIDGEVTTARSLPPRLGEHNDEILGPLRAAADNQ